VTSREPISWLQPPPPSSSRTLVVRRSIQVAFVLSPDITGAPLSSIIGTPYWMAPEVIKQKGHGTPADIWSLGCTVIEMLTGAPPFSEYPEPQAAMFHIAQSQTGPTLPSTASTTGRDFLALCFHIEPSSRAVTDDLLKHAFATSSEDPVVQEEVRALTQSMLDSDLIIFPFSILPAGIIACIFAFVQDEALVSLVCKRWNSIRLGIRSSHLDAPKKIAFQAQKRRWQRHLFSIQQFSRSHKAPITDSVCSGDIAITSADDRRLKIWAVDKPKLKTSYKAPAVVTCMRLDSQANTLWTGCSDKTIRSWPLTGRFRPGLAITHHSEAVTSLALQPGKLLSASLDQTVKETDIATGRLISTLKGHTKGILALDVCLDKQVVLSGSADTTIKVWDLRTGNCQRTIKGWLPSNRQAT
jgi:serine/threonine protein kinase